METPEGLCDSDYWSRTGPLDHWKGAYTRSSPKGRIEVAWNHVSASQIETFVKCKRLWTFKSILKMPEVQKGHQSLGEGFHMIMERVPQGLTVDHADVNASPEDWTKAEAMAKQALPLMPQGQGQKREHGFRLETYPGGPTMVGYIDLAIPRGIGWPAFLIPANEAIVVDYKTLSDFRYMKTPQELADSVQMMTYAKWAISPWPSGLQTEADKDVLDLSPLDRNVRLVHMYARTKAPFNRQSIRNESAIVAPEDINARWGKTLDIVREMQQVSACTDANEVEAGGALNGHCEAYGGCSFRDKCGISKSSGIKGLFQVGKKPQGELMGSAIMDKIRAAQAAQSQLNAASATQPSTVAPSANPQTVETVAAKAPSPVPVETTIQVKGPVSGLLAKIQSQGKGLPVLKGSVGQGYAKEQGYANSNGVFGGSGERASIQVETLGELMKLAAGVVPPDAPARTQEVITRPGDAVVDPLKSDEGEDDEETVSTSDVPVSPSPMAGVNEPSVSTGEVTKRRGRPSNAELATREAATKKAFEDAVNDEVTRRLAGDVTAQNLISGQVDLQKQLAQAKAELQVYKQETTDLTSQVHSLKKGNSDLASQVRNPGMASVDTGLTLYVDCFPVKGDRECVDFFEWIGPICAGVAQANDVGDWRQINYTAKALLANAIRQTVKEQGTPRALAISSYAGGADVALEILTPIAKRVIKKL